MASLNYALQAGQEVEYLQANAGSTGLTLNGGVGKDVETAPPLWGQVPD